MPFFHEKLRFVYFTTPFFAVLLRGFCCYCLLGCCWFCCALKNSSACAGSRVFVNFCGVATYFSHNPIHVSMCLKKLYISTKLQFFSVRQNKIKSCVRETRTRQTARKTPKSESSCFGRRVESENRA